ncbi:MAG: DUF421 domain-containing protein [Candidatus Babeliales bacterium]
MEAPHIDISRIFLGDIASWHFVLETVMRVGLIFTCTLLVFHFFYRKNIVEFTSTELIAMLVLGTIIGDTAFYHSVPLLQSFVALCSTLLSARLVAYLGKKSERVESLVADKTVPLIQQGQIIAGNLDNANITRAELLALLRLQGISYTGEVDYAFMEQNGQLSIIWAKSPYPTGISTIESVIKRS